MENNRILQNNKISHFILRIDFYEKTFRLTIKCCLNP